MYLQDKEKFILPLVVKKADPFSLESLIAWLRTKPAAATYDYGCNGSCLIAQYLPAMGVKCAGVIPNGYREGELRLYLPFPAVFEDIALTSPHKFGAALTRAQAALERLPRSFLQAEGGK